MSVQAGEGLSYQESPTCEGITRDRDQCPRVHAFTVLSRKLDVGGSPLAGAFIPRQPTTTNFRKYYDRSDLPIFITHGHVDGMNKVAWKVEIEKLDYHHFLPIFFDGLSELEFPLSILACMGCLDLLEHGGSKILPVVPQIIIPIKNAMGTRNHMAMVRTLKVIKRLAGSGEMVGEALVPYYRQILPIFNFFRNKNVNIGDDIHYGQQKRVVLGDAIDDTLAALEKHGGEEALINIKYLVPAYESHMLN